MVVCQTLFLILKEKKKTITTHNLDAIDSLYACVCVYLILDFFNAFEKGRKRYHFFSRIRKDNGFQEKSLLKFCQETSHKRCHYAHRTENTYF